MPPKIEMIGKRFGRLYVFSEESKTGCRGLSWKCVCDCGNVVCVDGYKLRSGHTQSCGCLQRERTSEISRTHGASGGRLFRIWANMKSRCNNPNLPRWGDYGGRGIRVCDAWNDNFQTFYDWAIANGYSDELTIDRINNNGDYCPENCRWATDEEQRLNTRRNRFLTYRGSTRTVKEWANLKGIPYSVLSSRINRYGWTVEKALETERRLVRKRT